ncbi:hypothetical protein ACIHCX_31830 [Streptomyces sp. NPDC052043]|uniref:hypothetical protein n=1 Tax=Streptomyces sp. NPDC052043 TaxID=3365684 RepID=UPI0037D7DF51
MVFVAVLLLPLMSVLLAVLDHVEERILDPAPARGRRAGRRGPLRLLPDGHRRTRAGTGPVGSAADPPGSGERQRTV